MNRPVSTWIPLLAALGLASPALASDVVSHLELTGDVTRGALRIADPDGGLIECPLQHTEVEADISGFIVRVRVKQSFVNPLDEPIEAVYVFPLSSTGAVDEMTMVIGTRRIVGVIERRDDARRIYENAMARGATASLLEQERPNIFTQSVANIPPGGRVDIEIGYVDVLAYDSGAYEFRFPMVVGPRFIPGAPTSALPDTPTELQGRVGEVAPRSGQNPTGTGWSPDTTRVPDASRITPRVLRPGTRTGHDVSLKVRLDAGVKIRNLVSTSHEVRTRRLDAQRASVEIAAADTLPNKDFVLRYAVAGERPEVGLLAHSSAGGDGTFLLMLQPRQLDDELAKAPPREVCFLIDVSGSMSGQPTAKVREIMERFFERAKPEDRIQVVTFASRAERLFSGYVPASKQNVERALGFTRSLRGGGGTQMLEGIRAVLQDPVDPERVRIVMLLSDGYIGNEAEIIREVGQRTGDRLRFWSRGIGSSPNRYLIDGVAAQGGGDSAVVGLGDDTRELVGRITDRIHRSQLADIQIDWGGLDVFETYPARLPDLWAGQPVFVLGRYRGHGEATIELRGSVEGQPASFRKRVDLPASEPRHGALTSAWARRKIADLDAKRIVYGAQELVEDITALALEHRLMTAYTSFVAVDAETLGEHREAQRPLRMLVPVPLPQGTRFEGFFGERESYEVDEIMALASLSDRKVAHKAKRRLAAATPAPGRLEQARTASFAGVMNAPAPVAAQDAFARQAPAGLASAPPATLTRSPSSGTTRAKIEEMLFDGRVDRDFTSRQLLDPFVERARIAVERRDWQEARRQLQIAYLLGAGGSLKQDWQEMERVAHRHAITALPALGQEAGLLIRNQSLRESLASLSKLGGLEIHLVPGSLGDIRDALGRSELRIALLDVRGATLAQALSWSLDGLGLEWSVVGQGVTVTSARRAPGTTAWAYALADLAPDAETAAEIALEVRRRLGAGDDLAERRAAILTGTNLVVRADAAGHETTARLLTTLRDAGASIEPKLTGLQQRVAEHWTGRAERREARARTRRAKQVNRHSWRLIASVQAASTDAEAVAALHEIASDPAGLAGLDPDLHARLLFAVGVARAAHPDDTPLAELAELTFRSIPKSGTSPSSQGVVYRRLLGRLPASVVPRSLADGNQDALQLEAHEETLVDELLRSSGEVGDLLRGARATPNEDLVVLAGLKAARSGPGAWSDFRVQIANGGLSLSGPALRALLSLEYVASLISEAGDVAELTMIRETPPSRSASSRPTSGVGASMGVIAVAALLALRLR